MKEIYGNNLASNLFLKHKILAKTFRCCLTFSEVYILYDSEY